MFGVIREERVARVDVEAFLSLATCIRLATSTNASPLRMMERERDRER